MISIPSEESYFNEVYKGYRVVQGASVVDFATYDAMCHYLESFQIEFPDFDTSNVSVYRIVIYSPEI